MIAGIVFCGAFDTILEAANTETFCIGCHEMRENVFVELQAHRLPVLPESTAGVAE